MRSNAKLLEACELLLTEARGLGHDVSPFLPGGYPFAQRTACRGCGASYRVRVVGTVEILTSEAGEPCPNRCRSASTKETRSTPLRSASDAAGRSSGAEAPYLRSALIASSSQIAPAAAVGRRPPSAGRRSPRGRAEAPLSAS
jgi:hypothetical protein